MPILITGDIEDCEKEALQALLDTDKNGTIDIYINSGGGSVYSAMAIRAMIRQREITATAYVLADCSSSALIIFAACRWRHMYRGSSCLFHRMRCESGSMIPGNNTDNWAKEMRRLDEQATLAIACDLEGSDLSHAEILLAEKNGRYLTADEMKQRGVAEIIDN